MIASALPFSPVAPALSLFAAPEETAAPSERVVAAVLEFGDRREEREDGLTAVSFTPARLQGSDMALLLEGERTRALDVIVLWDEDECEMVRVVDLAPLRAGRDGLEAVNRYAAARGRTLRRGALEVHAWAA